MFILKVIAVIVVAVALLMVLLLLGMTLLDEWYTLRKKYRREEEQPTPSRSMDNLQFTLDAHARVIKETAKECDDLRNKVLVLEGTVKLLTDVIGSGERAIPGIYDHPSPAKRHLDNLMKG